MSLKKTIMIATFARSDYSSCLPIIQLLKDKREFNTRLVVSGMHLSKAFGETVRDIINDGHVADEYIDMQFSVDNLDAICQAIGIGISEFSKLFSEKRPDILLLVGDRTELISAAYPALLHGIPIAHVSGGDNTEGAIDNQVRNAISKLSSLHFVAMKEHKNRLLQMGEEDWRVSVSGDPALDLLKKIEYLSAEQLSADLGIDLVSPIFLVTYHPTTISTSSAKEEIEALLGGLKAFDGTFIFSLPNADFGNSEIKFRLQEFIQKRNNSILISNLGQQRYYSLLRIADIMVGNSSSGIWESPSFKIPVVNIGDRQKGRVAMNNVIQSAPESNKIFNAVNLALSEEFKNSLSSIYNPYGQGDAANIIVDYLKLHIGNPNLIRKKFIDHKINISNC